MIEGPGPKPMQHLLQVATGYLSSAALWVAAQLRVRLLAMGGISTESAPGEFALTSLPSCSARVTRTACAT
jgi:hypothetical protein